VVVIVESLRAFGFSQRPIREHLPFLAEMSSRGIVCENHFSTATHSNYADVSLLDGQYPLRSPTQHNYSRDDYGVAPPIHTLLQTSGFRCGNFSAQDETWGGMHHATMLDRFDRSLHVRTRPRLSSDAHNFGTPRANAGKLLDETVLACACEWLQEDRGRPAFAVVNLQGSHFPYRVDSGKERFVKPPPGARFGRYALELVPAMQERYLASLRFIDGLLRDFVLDITARSPRPVTVLITGDTGQSFMECGRAGHGAELLDEVIRVPLVVFSEHLTRHPVIEPTSHVDVLPTLLGICRVAPPPWLRIDGIDIARQTRNASGVFALAQTPMASQVGIITPQMKLVRDFRTGYDYEIEYAGNRLLDTYPHGRSHSLRRLGEELDDFLTRKLRSAPLRRPSRVQDLTGV
jgi:membrane-anchored protein YejM (alkaline phosphatase superfamily)